jgi:hypothetical protein
MSTCYLLQGAGLTWRRHCDAMLQTLQDAVIWRLCANALVLWLQLLHDTYASTCAFEWNLLVDPEFAILLIKCC